MDDFMPDDYRLGKKERPDPRLGPEIRTVDLNVVPNHRRQENNNGKIPGIVLKVVFLGIVMALLPLIQKQSPQSSITRSWDMIPLLFVGLAVSYGLIMRRPGAVAEKEKNDDGAAQGTHDYVQTMFDFAGVFDDYNSGGDEVLTKNKAEAFSSMWRSEEPLHVMVDNGDENVTDKPLFLPIRSLKHSISNPHDFDLLEEADNADVSSSKPAVAASAQGDPKLLKSEVRRNGEIFSVESGNFEAELNNMFDNDEPAVFRSPIPWSSRPDVLNIKDSLPPAPAADNLRSDEGKIEDVVPSVFSSPIPWSSRLDPSTVPPAVENKPSDDGKQKINGENPPSSGLSDKQDCKHQVPPSRPPPPPPPPTVIERQPCEKNFPTRSVQKAASSSPRSSPSPSVSPSPRPRPSPSPSPTPRQTPRSSPSLSPSPRQTPRPSPSPTRPPSGRQANGSSPAPSGIPLHKFSSPRPSPSPTRSRPVVMQNGSSKKQPNPIQMNKDEVGLTKKDDSAQRNMNEMTPPSPPPSPTPAAADDPRSGKPEKKVPVASSPSSPASPTVAANGFAHEIRSSQRYDPNQSNGDVSRQKIIKDVLSSASYDEIKPRRGSIHPPAPPPGLPCEDLSAPKKPLENGFSHRSESRSKIRDASSDGSESTSKSRGATAHLSHSRHNSRDIEADFSVSKQKTRDADVLPQMQFEKSSRKDPSHSPPPPPPTPPVHVDVPFSDSFPQPQPPPRPPFLDEDDDEDQPTTINEEEVDQKADEFIAKFRRQMRLDKAQSYRERVDQGQKLGMKNDLS